MACSMNEFEYGLFYNIKITTYCLIMFGLDLPYGKEWLGRAAKFIGAWEEDSQKCFWLGGKFSAKLDKKQTKSQEMES